MRGAFEFDSGRAHDGSLTRVTVTRVPLPFEEEKEEEDEEEDGYEDEDGNQEEEEENQDDDELTNVKDPAI